MTSPLGAVGVDPGDVEFLLKQIQEAARYQVVRTNHIIRSFILIFLEKERLGQEELAQPRGVLKRR